MGWVFIPNGKGKGKGVQALLALSMKGGAKGASKNGWSPTVAQAINEIKEQLRDPDNPGNVWIQGWGSRFQGELGTLRDFLESRPDKFTVIPGEGKKFSVQLASHGDAGSGEAAAFKEVTAQLRKQGGSGNVWINQWGKRFESTLGSLRDFLESHPDKFTVIAGEGKKYSVALAEGELAQGKRKRPAPKTDNTPSKKVKAVVLKEDKATGEDLEEEAVQAINQQISRPGFDGRVWVRDWGRKFQSTFGSLRDFLDSKPDEFTVIPGEGNKFTVEKA